jgi:acetyl-CoA C-acetyltransferase
VTLKGAACIAGAFEHPTREAPDRTTAQLLAEVSAGALADAGIDRDDVDGLYCDGTLGSGAMSLAGYLGFNRLSSIDATNTGGSSYLLHVGHAAAAIAMGKCHIALVAMAGRPRSENRGRPTFAGAPELAFEEVFGPTQPGMYALAARRHMHEFGTTSAQLAAIKVSASIHAQHNPNALLRKAVTVDEVLESPMISDPLHRLDCCVTTDGGGAIVVVSPEVARTLERPVVTVLGQGETVEHTANGYLDLTVTGAARSGPAAFAEAGVAPSDIDYASIYDSFTITVLETIEDLGFCEKGKGGAFVADGGLTAPGGRLPFNTDGGGLCNNHPGRRGGMTKIIEAVRQLRGEAHPAVQVPDCELALVHGTGGNLSARHASATLILGRDA